MENSEAVFIPNMGQTRQDKTRQDKTRQDKTRQDKTRQDKTRQDKTNMGHSLREIPTIKTKDRLRIREG